MPPLKPDVKYPSGVNAGGLSVLVSGCIWITLGCTEQHTSNAGRSQDVDHTSADALNETSQASDAGADPVNLTGVWTGNLHDVVSPCLDFRGATRDVRLQLTLTQTGNDVAGTLTILPGLAHVEVHGTFDGQQLLLAETELAGLRFTALSVQLEGGALLNPTLSHSSVESAGDYNPVCSALGNLRLERDTMPPLEPRVSLAYAANTLLLDFGEPLDSRTQCTVSASNGQTVNIEELRGALSSSVSHGFRVTPIGFWDPQAEYRLQVREVRDVAGNQLPDIDTVLPVAPLDAIETSASFDGPEPLEAWAGENCELLQSYSNEDGTTRAATEGQTFAACERLAGYFLPPRGATALTFEWAPLCPRDSLPEPCYTLSSSEFEIRLINRSGERTMQSDTTEGSTAATFRTGRFALESRDADGFWLEIRSREQYVDASGALYWLPFLADDFHFVIDAPDAGNP